MSNEVKHFGKVAHIIDSFTIVMNKGDIDGVSVGDTFRIVSLGNTITDPDSGEELGQLEIIKGNAKAIHVQEKFATLESTNYESLPDRQEIIKNSTISWISGAQETRKIIPGGKKKKGFNNVKVGDLILRRK